MKKVAVFGAGRIGQIHARNLAVLNGVEIAGIYDPIAENAKKLASDLNCKIASVDELLGDKSISAVLICSSTDSHSDLIKRSALAKKQIFCEKPVDLSAERALECEKVVKDNGVACMIAFQRRFDPTFNSAKTRILNGEIGEVEMLIVTSRDPGAPPAKYLTASGGIFRDMLIHDFDIFRWILCDNDEPAWISANGGNLIDPEIGQIGDADCTIVSLKTKKGKLAQINTSRRAAYGYDQRFEVLGSKGMIQCGNHKPTEVTISNDKAVSIDKPEDFFLQRYREAYRLEIEHFFECLQSGKAFRTTIKDGVAAQKLADAATESWKSGKVINL